jgi:hypothetical protein
MTDGWHDTPTPRELRGLPRTSYARSHAMPWDDVMREQELAALAQTANAAVQDLDRALAEYGEGLTGAALLECASLADSLDDLRRRLRALGAEIPA